MVGANYLIYFSKEWVSYYEKNSRVISIWNTETLMWYLGNRKVDSLITCHSLSENPYAQFNL